MATSGNLNLHTIDFQIEFQKQVRNGEVSILELKSTFEWVLSQEQAIKAELLTLKVKELQKLYNSAHSLSGLKKADLVERIYTKMQSFYTLNKGVSFMVGESYLDKIAETVMGLTQQDLDHYLEELRVYMADRQKRIEVRKKAIENPETLEEFEIFIFSKGKESLSIEQSARFDQLMAEKALRRMEKVQARKAVVEKVSFEGLDLKLITAVHTKTQEPLWIVQLPDRVERHIYDELKIKAKALGGWYSSFIKTQAGFHFKNEDSAKKFIDLQKESVDRSDILEAKEEARQERSSERLEEQAERLINQGGQSLQVDRLANTARRASFAAQAEQKAQEDIRLGNTLKNIASALIAGELTYLQKVTTKAQVEVLESLIYSAKLKNAYSETEREVLKVRKINEEEIAAIAYPWPIVWKGHLVDGCKILENAKNCKRIIQSILQMAERQNRVKFKTASELELRSEFSAKLAKIDPSCRLVSILKDSAWPMRQLQKLGIYDDHTLRMAIREFVQYQEISFIPNPIKKLERDLIGCKIPGYFPTPHELAGFLVHCAHIKPGQKILEPSAGKGNIADAILKNEPFVDLSVIECNSQLKAILEAKKYHIVDSDFMNHCDRYDRIVMNPPFENLADIDHVKRAYSLLKEGGVLVSIMSESPFFRSDSKAQGFREWLETVQGESHKLPEGSFKSSEQPTGVSTRYVIIRK